MDQLPSVGAGEVLRDILAADTIPRVRLTTIFRPAQQSGVVVNAHRINAGQSPVFGVHPDFFLFPADEPEATAERVVDLVANRIPRRFGIPPRDIQVLVPMHRGPAGAGTLNTLLQQALAPGGAGRQPPTGAPGRVRSGRHSRLSTPRRSPVADGELAPVLSRPAQGRRRAERGGGGRCACQLLRLSRMGCLHQYARAAAGIELGSCPCRRG